MASRLQSPPRSSLPPPPPPSPHAPQPDFSRRAPAPGLATAALVCGITGLVLFFVVVPSIVALVLGLIAWNRARATPAPGDGRGRALAGWILGMIGVLGFVAFVIGAVATNGFEADTISIYDVRPGQCIDFADDSDIVADVPRRDCDEPHDGEVFLVSSVGDADEFPGISELDRRAEAACIGDAFEQYVGTAYDDSALTVTYVTPSEDSWAAGDRDVVCVATLPDSDKLTATVEGSNQ
jgi:Domain of unknown function (DUF4190)/Septum formation